MSDNEQSRMIATAMNEGSPQAKALGFSTLEIGDAVAYLRTITGLNFYITPKAQSEKEDVRVPLQVDDVAVSSILDLMTSQNGMKWEVRDGLVRIATAEEVSGSFLLRYFDMYTFRLKYVGNGYQLLGGFFSEENPDFFFTGNLLK